MVWGSIHRHLILLAAALLHHSQGKRVTLHIPFVTSHKSSLARTHPDPLSPAHLWVPTHTCPPHQQLEHSVFFPRHFSVQAALTTVCPNVRKGVIQEHKVLTSYIYSHTYQLTVNTEPALLLKEDLDQEKSACSFSYPQSKETRKLLPQLRRWMAAQEYTGRCMFLAQQQPSACTRMKTSNRLRAVMGSLATLKVPGEL